jgi:hypothetical protein
MPERNIGGVAVDLGAACRNAQITTPMKKLSRNSIIQLSANCLSSV